MLLSPGGYRSSSPGCLLRLDTKITGQTNCECFEPYESSDKIADSVTSQPVFWNGFSIHDHNRATSAIPSPV